MEFKLSVTQNITVNLRFLKETLISSKNVKRIVCISQMCDDNNQG